MNGVLATEASYGSDLKGSALADLSLYEYRECLCAVSLTSLTKPIEGSCAAFQNDLVQDDLVWRLLLPILIELYIADGT